VPRHLATITATLSLPVLLLGACRVEQTPEEYIDHQDRVEAERRAAGGEVEDRLRAFVAAVGRGDPTEAEIALNPAEDVEVLGPSRDLEVSGIAPARLILERMASTPVAVRIREISVEPAPVPTVAWFNLLVEAPGSEPQPALYRVTGVYRRDAGLWLMEQAHISGPLREPGPPPSSPSGTAGDPAEGE
jgi:hypothetical protein